MRRPKDFIPDIKDMPLGTINGAAEENVELAVARDIGEIEVRMGQPVGTVDIPKFVAAIHRPSIGDAPDPEKSLRKTLAKRDLQTKETRICWRFAE
jgi:hypothetical protein